MAEATIQDRFRGVMLGLAVGDALGAPVEFLTRKQIINRYGPNGITDYDAWRGHMPGSWTDDTDMSIATAQGLLMWIRDGKKNPVRDYVFEAYRDWALNVDISRSPGSTCMRALHYPYSRIASRGCGGVMRVAPVGLAFSGKSAFHFGKQFAHLTHDDPYSDLASGFLARLISGLVRRKDEFAFNDAYYVAWDNSAGAESLLPLLLAARDSAPGVLEFGDPAYEYCMLNLSDFREKEKSGKGFGWTADDALVCAVFCSEAYPDDFRKAVTLAVNISGDSDSTGSITGAIMGAKLGVEAIPQEWLSRLEAASFLEEQADLLYEYASKEQRR